MEKEEKFKAIATKISRPAYRKLKKLAKAKGLTVYDILQMCVDTLIRYMSDRHNLTPEMERAMSIFEHMTGWRNSANLADYTADWQIKEATLYLTAKGKQGIRAVHVELPFMGQKRETENIQEITERFFNYVLPERYKRLRLVASYVGATSMIDLLDRMIDSYDVLELSNKEIREGFQDADRAENNKPLRYGERTRRKKHESVEGYEAKQQTFHFNAEDLPESRKEEPFDIDRDAIGL